VLDVPEQLVASLAELDELVLEELITATDPSTWSTIARLHGVDGFGVIRDLAVLRQAAELAWTRRAETKNPSFKPES
jgi:hypothetical protein